MIDVLPGENPVIVETGTRKHITSCVSSSISDDGMTAMVVFTVAGLDGAADDKFAVTMSVEHVPLLRAVFHDVLSKIPKRSMNPQVVMFQTRGPTGVEQIDVASPDGQQIILRLCPNRPEEMPWVMTLDTALKLGALLRDLPRQLEAARQSQLFRQDNKLSS